LIYTDFAAIPPLSYDVILADPPWHFDVYSEAGEAKSPQAQYKTMSPDEIKAMPVSHLCRGDALIMMWACWHSLPLALEVMGAWDFRYVTGGSWHKRTRHGKTNFGTGYRLRSATEPYLIGTLGNPTTAKNIRNIIDEAEIDSENLGHSRKPDDQYAMLEHLCTGAMRKVELFSRKSADGWDAWGNECGKFDEK
jgi:N6-adenosine-specific RNA methylase IME4